MHCGCGMNQGQSQSYGHHSLLIYMCTFTHQAHIKYYFNAIPEHHPFITCFSLLTNKCIQYVKRLNLLHETRTD